MSKFKVGVEALRPKRKKGKFTRANTKAYETALDGAYDKAETQMLKFYAKTVQTWKGQPIAKVNRITRGKFLFLELDIQSRVWHWLNEGTKRHFIKPKRVLALRFRSGYKAKTSPRRLNSRGGGGFGNFAFSKGHWVSGIKARKWSQIIERAGAKTLSFHSQKNIQKEFDKVAKEANR